MFFNPTKFGQRSAIASKVSAVTETAARPGNVVDEEGQLGTHGEIDEKRDKTALRRPHVIGSNQSASAPALSARASSINAWRGSRRDTRGRWFAAARGLNCDLDQPRFLLQRERGRLSAGGVDEEAVCALPYLPLNQFCV